MKNIVKRQWYVDVVRCLQRKKQEAERKEKKIKMK